MQEFLAPYQRAKPDFAVTLVDPREEPKLAQAAGIRADGESVIEYNQKSEHLTEYNEQSLVNVLMRLARSGERLAMSLEGHGERRLDRHRQPRSRRVRQAARGEGVQDQ